MALVEDYAYIDQDRVMIEATNNDFEYLLSFLTTNDRVFYIENGKTFLIKHQGQFPTKWLSYLTPPEEPFSMKYKIHKPPSLFHYIVKYNRMDILLELDKTETFIWACRSLCGYGISWLFLAEAIWQCNESFVTFAWMRLEQVYKGRYIHIHWLFIEDPELFIYLLRTIQTDSKREFYLDLHRTLVSNFKELKYTIDEDWFKYKETREFFQNEIQFINSNSHDPLTQWYKYREYENTLEKNELIINIVLDTKVSTDIIKYIIVPYVI
jgi:hypothetical protein